MLFLVSAVERNIYDQRSLEYHIYENHGEVKVIRRTLQQIRSGGFLTPNKELIVSVAVLVVVVVVDWWQILISRMQLLHRNQFYVNV